MSERGTWMLGGPGAPMALTPTTAREVVAQLREAGRGAIVVTSGIRDLRLLVVHQGIHVEGIGGVELPGGEDSRDLIRAFLCALFWEDPVVLVDQQAEPRDGVTAVRVPVRTDAKPILDQLEQGCAELEGLRQQVPGLEAVVTVSGQPPPDGDDSPTARLFRALKAQPGATAPLGLVAADLGLDPLDAAWAVADLLEGKQATVKRPAPTVTIRRVKRAEALVDQGFVPGLRCVHCARGHHRADPKAAASWMRRAGDAFRREVRHEQALACYRACLDALPDDVLAREGLALSLTALSRTPEVNKLHDELARIYAANGLPARAARHLRLLTEPTEDQQRLLLECLLHTGDFADAAEHAARIARQLTPPERAGLAQRFVAAGASGEPLQRVIDLSGARALKGARRLLGGVAVVGLLVAGLLGAEARLRLRFREVGDLVRGHVIAGRFDAARAAVEELAPLASSVPAGLQRHTCLGQVGQVYSDIGDLEADTALLAERRAVLAWREANEMLAADLALERLGVQARTNALRKRVAALRAELADYKARVTDDVKRLDDLVLAGKRQDALELARTLAGEHGRARDAWVGHAVALQVYARPIDATVTWKGQLLKPLAPGEYEVRLPLDDSPGELLVTGPAHVPQRKELRFSALERPTMSIELVKTVREPSLTWPTTPAGAAGLVVLEEPTGLGRVAQTVKGKLDGTPAPEPELAPVAALLQPGQRLVLLLRTDVTRARKPVLTAIDVFLEEGSKRGVPWRVEPVKDSVSRAPVEDAARGGWVLPPVSRLPELPLLRAALLEVVGRMQQELKP